MLRLSPREEVALGVLDLRYRWRDATPNVRAPAWIVGPPDFNALAAAVGVSQVVEVGDG
jgi:hypothetical protein